MNVLKRDLRIRSDEPPHVIAPHVVTRIATALHEGVERYDDARVYRSCALITLGHRGFIVNVLCGLDLKESDVGVRIQVDNNAGARWAAAAFPTVIALFGYVGVAYIKDPGLVISWLAIGTLVALFASYGVFRLVRRLRLGSEDFLRQGGRIARRVQRLIEEAVAGLGLTVEEDDVRIAGFDADPPTAMGQPSEDDALALGDGAAWKKLMTQAVASSPH